jgi:quinol monooxygenase YgiN
MYTIIGTVTARPETRDELATLLAAQVAPTRAEEGCINYDFHVDAADPCVFVFYENWTSRAALDAHLAMPHLQPLFSQLERLLACPVDIRPLTMLSDLAG